MKKIILTTIVIFFCVILTPQSFADKCIIDEKSNDSVSKILTDCIETSDSLVITGDGKNLKVGEWTNILFKKIIANLWILLSLGAVLMIVYSWFLMTLSGWEDEKIKKWKELLKWTLIWYIALLSAGWIISLVISSIYNFSEIA